MERTVGVALGGGGARGLAHVLALKSIEACGVRPAAIAGTSMGAIVGAVYASGMSAGNIRQQLETHLVTKNDGIEGVVRKASSLIRWLALLGVERKRGGLFKADRFLERVLSDLGCSTFEELQMPLQVVTTDFWSGEEVVFTSGDLLPALRASMAIPGVFAPVVVDGRVLVDGGIANNVPFDLLKDTCDTTIAIDVAPVRSSDDSSIPNAADAVVGMFDMLVEKVTRAKLSEHSPTMYVNPNIRDVQVLEFDKIGSVFEQSAGPMDEFKTKLERLLRD